MGALSHHLGLAAGTAAILAGELLIAAPGIAQQAPMPLLTDTPAYCAQLSNLVEAGQRSLISPAPPEIEQLAEEGRRLCALGEVRAGVARLRQAVVLLRQVSGQS